ncbi:hypothetical protein FEM33_23700 [Dyadobacter flavalbus]|uniref:Uncharacterized protein n=1 Tax=Dyadobacter flavalbus TaxID=2579942 RepID=A0A5M8Q9R7_9BACT|nr:hypothetical protein [Dyadobacter flavalbus]KAA6432727.1 hypothetical protein FEM33_23700 [Dyadobacter flavalbus]
MSVLPDFTLPELQFVRLFQNCIKAVRIWLVATSGFALFSCDNYRPAEPPVIQYVKIANVHRDTVVAIPNEKSAVTARIAFTETLSDTAIVRISPDTAFSQHGSVFLLPITNPTLMYISGLSGDSLFLQYQPYKRPISGNLTIEIEFQK